MTMKTKRQGKIYWLTMGVLLTLLSSSLVLLVLLASHMRLSGDDYCYNAVLTQKGFLGMQTHSYLRVGMYNGNRYSLTFFSGLAGMFPTIGSGLLSILSLLAWLVGLTLVVRWIVKEFYVNLTLLESIVISEVFACLVLWSTPDLSQSFFWRSAMLPYFLPLMGVTWLTLFAIKAAESEGVKWVKLVLVLLVAVIVGGFSETGAAFQGGFFSLVLVAIGISASFGDKQYRKYAFPVVMLLFGTIVAVTLMYFSPTTAIRRANLPVPMTLVELLSLLGLNIKIYLWQALMRRSLTVIIPLIFGFGAKTIYFFYPRKGTDQKSINLTWQQTVLLIIFLGVASIILIGGILLPGTYIFADYPPARALILSQAVLMGVCVSVGVLIAFLFESLFSMIHLKAGWLKGLHRGLGLVMILCVLIAPIMLLQSSVNQLRFFRKWSQLWDERHYILLEVGRRNVDDIHVIELDHVIKDVGELSPDPDYWYNNCAEMYYEISAIYADQPGW